MNQLYITALVLAAAMPQSGAVPPFPKPRNFCSPIPRIPIHIPLVRDCEEALEQFRLDPPAPCTDIIDYEKDIVTVRTCTVRTYSDEGRVNCFDRDQIEEGIISILASCSSNGFTGGLNKWTEPSILVEGVMLVWFNMEEETP